MRNLFSFRILFVYTAFVIFISVTPVSVSNVDSFPFLDKIIHFLIYTLLAFLAINTFKISSGKNCYIKVFLYCFFVGTLIECIQYFLPFRGFETFDILANSAGTVAGIFVRIT